MTEGEYDPHGAGGIIFLIVTIMIAWVLFRSCR